MIIYLSTKDMAHILSAHLFNNGLANEAKLDMDFGIVNGEIVAVAAAGESLPVIQTVADLTAPRTSGAVVDSTDDADEESDYEEGSDGDEPANADGSKKQKRKRRTKAEIEQDRLNAEKAAAAEAGTGSENSKADETPAQAEAEVEPNEADDVAPFDVDEGANIRAEAELLPEANPVDAAEEDAAATEKAEPVSDPNDPFAQVEEVSQEGDELFAQPGEVVTPVTDKADGFVKPAEEDPEDPFANFN